MRSLLASTLSCSRKGNSREGTGQLARHVCPAVDRGTMRSMSGETEQQTAARQLAHQAHEVGRASGREPWREFLQRISGGRVGRRRGRFVVPLLGTPWQDTLSDERTGWRQRAASLDGEFVFAVDYQICQQCSLAWVEQPYTLPPYQRCGLAAAGLSALRDEHPGLSWHTLGGHFSESEPFWAAAGEGVPGGYRQRRLCSHVNRGG